MDAREGDYLDANWVGDYTAAMGGNAASLMKAF